MELRVREMGKRKRGERREEGGRRKGGNVGGRKKRDKYNVEGLTFNMRDSSWVGGEGQEVGVRRSDVCER